MIEATFYICIREEGHIIWEGREKNNHPPVWDQSGTQFLSAFIYIFI